MIRAAFILIILAWVAALQQTDSGELRTAGRTLYVSLCQRCHGETGDSTGYPGITPLAGITLRIPDSEIAGLSAPFVGRTFQGKEATALVAYLDSLRGEKGFERPGYLASLYLLHRKLGETRQYRIIDVRPEAEYQAGHIPNAVAWRQNEPSSTLLQRLGNLGAGPDSFVVIYDGVGGPRATALWLELRRGGHLRAAVLDGGFAGWKEAYPVSAAPVSFGPVPYSPAGRPESADSRGCQGYPEKIVGVGEGRGPKGPSFDWRKTRGDEGLLPASEVRAYLQGIGIGPSARYSLPGDPAERAYLVFLLHLLGSNPEVFPDGERLCLAGSDSKGTSQAQPWLVRSVVWHDSTGTDQPEPLSIEAVVWGSF